VADPIRRLARCAAAIAAIAIAVASPACRQGDARPPLLEGAEPAPGIGGGSTVGGAGDAGDPDGAGATVFVETGAPPTAVAVDANAVYFAMGTADPSADAGVFPAGSIVRVPRAGGVAAPIVTGAVRPTRILVSGAALVFVDDDPRGGRVLGVSLDAGTVTPLATGFASPSAIASDGAYVYIASSSGGTGVQVDRVNLAGGQQPSPVATIAGDLDPRGLAIAGATAVFVAAEQVGGSVLTAPSAGGPAETIGAILTGDLGDVAIAGADAFVASGGAAGSIVRVPLARGTPSPLASGEADPAAITVDGDNVYWLRRGTGELVRAPAAGGDPVVLASGLDGARALAVGAAWTYVATSHAIVRAPK